MKFNKHIATVSTVIIATVASVSAIERSAPAAQPKEKANKAIPAPRVLPNAAPANEQMPPLNDAAPLDMPQVNGFRPFLGVAGSPITEALAAQLGLENNVGITLDTIARNSPASKAGLKKHDIITTLAGKDIRTQEDLRNAVLAHKNGDKVELKYITKGEQKVIQVELGKAAKVPRVAGPAPVLPKDFFDKFPPEQREKIKEMIEGNLKNFHGLEGFRQLNPKDLEGFNDKPQMFHFQFDDLLKGVQGNANGAAQGRLMMMDANGSITLKSAKEGKLLELRDRTGKLQYSGPFNNEADKLKVPEEFRDRIKQLDPKKALGKANMMTPEQLMKMLGDDMPNLPLLNELRLREGGAGEGKALRFHLNLNQQGNPSLTDPITGNTYKLLKTKEGFDVEALDSDKKLLFSGPYNSEFDKNSVPEEFRPHFDSLKNLGNGKPLEFKFGQ